LILVQNDKRRLTYRLKKAGAPFPGLSTAAISWKLKKPSAETVSETMTLQDEATATVYVDPVDGGDASHFDELGEHAVEIVVTPSGSAAEYPERPLRIVVRAEYVEAVA
jgi:hypothetical protein